MNIRKLQRGLSYCGRVEAVRQTYHVFEASGDFLVLSFARSKARRGSGYFNFVQHEAVEFVRSRLARRRSGVTAKDAMQVAQRTRHVPSSLAGLNILYVLVGLGQARILRSGANRQLFFKLHKPRKPRARG
ncbi:MAG TPA: hypothetical protein VGF89_11870 [Steroidobacteraceae bacterium]|jgi:hypothetical protein